jgi:hypothetical protein
MEARANIGAPKEWHIISTSRSKQKEINYNLPKRQRLYHAPNFLQFTLIIVILDSYSRYSYEFDLH